MPSLLKRWLDGVYRLGSRDLRLQDCEDAEECLEPTVVPEGCEVEDPRPRDCKDAEECLEPTLVPKSYAIEDLTSEFVKYWSKIKEDDGDGLEEIQTSALERWHALQFEWGKSIEAYPIPLDSFVEILDDYFFLGSLRPYTEVMLMDDTSETIFWAGFTGSRKPASGTKYIEIKLKPPVSKLWGRAATKFFLATLLHEMAHALISIYSGPEKLLGVNRKRAETSGLTGHGPCWVKIAAAIEREANRSLGGSWYKWDLGIKDARDEESKVLRKWHGYEGIVAW